MIDMGWLTKDFELTVQNSNNPNISISAVRCSKDDWDITVQPHGNESFRLDDDAHNKVRCFLSFLQSSGFSISASRENGKPYCYNQHVASYQEAFEVISKTDEYLRKNDLIVH